MTTHTPGPWSACQNGTCPCHLIWCHDHPIATVESGEWGDSYPAIRLKEEAGTIGGVAEAYMEKMVYGSVPEDVATANARLIAAAPELLEALQQCISDIECTENFYGPHDGAQEVLALARGIVAKATGVQP